MHVSQHQPPPGEPTDGERPVARTTDARSGPPLPDLEAPTEDPADRPPAPARRSLYVPVRRGPAGAVVRLWRTPFGSRTAVAFTSDQRLRSVLGPTQPWIRLSESALRRMAEPLGAVHLTVDPVLTARPPASWPDAAAQAGEPGARVEPSTRAPHTQQPAGTAP
ncbi:SAV_915 family protein [Actinacidiphila sp. ITFR-21]|uniref:SAV_915 family protein n=1 Tax=Actinacidiphila sp. ITFR-21 TaxID=3075199 RepID=UPI002889DA93|nr:SAV_915 family protein [Streptomyces sp. ITFR-21]WNI18548.1 SAV_915 family protein [Streptomyces sp. ITFR-21]